MGDASEGQSAGDGRAATSHPPSPAPSVPPLDARSLFRELCLLCGLPLLVSVGYTVWLRVVGSSALADVAVTSVVLLIALGGAAANLRLVGRALALPTARDWGATLVVALIAAPSLSLAFWFLSWIGVPLFDGYLAPYRQDGWPDWVGYADVALITPIAEELLYRGLVQPKLEQIVSSTEALIVQAALFSAAHLSPVILATHFGMGLGLGWVRRRSGSLFPGILLHGAWNAWVLWSSG